MPGMKTVVK